jgi:hypothetical protein
MVLEKAHLKQVKIPEKSLLRRIGKSRNQQVSQRLKKKIKKAIGEVCINAQPKAVFKILPAHKYNGSLILDGEISLESQKLAYAMRNSRSVALFLATLGSKVDRIIKKHMRVRPNYGFLLDAAASLAAESAAQNVQDYLQNSLHEDENLTLRYSPGYCDWPLHEQRKLFKILPNETIGVHLSENFFMSPHKSVSGIMGICPNGTSNCTENPCLVCTNFDCPYRRAFSLQ